MKKIIKTSVCIATIVLSLNAKTEDKHIPEKTGDGHITVQTSTMGLGIEYNYPVNSVLSIGFGVNQFTMQTLVLIIFFILFSKFLKKVTECYVFLWQFFSLTLKK
jgi:hypothetical protein